ncbi:MAG: hypothetical protein ABI220_00145 [Candidatus Saccharimonadales bacterium]
MKYKDSAGFAKLLLIIAILIVAFVAISIIGVLQDGSTRSSAPSFASLPKVQSKTNNSGSSASNSPSDPNLQIDVSMAMVDVQGELRGYFDVTKSYPSDLSSPEQIISQSNAQSGNTGQDLIDEFTAPAGAKYVYSATPEGCTTAAKNCQQYTLNVIEISSGKSLDSVGSVEMQ